MHKDKYGLLSLQFFAEGAAAGGDGGSSPAEGAVNAGQQSVSLEDLGVPRSMAERHRARIANKAAVETPAQASEPVVEEVKQEPEASSAKVTLEDILKDPEENAKMQNIVKERLRKDKGELEKRRQLDDVLRIVANKAGIADYDINTVDVAALLAKVEGDTSYFEEQAFSSGKTAEELMAKSKQDREARTKRNLQLEGHFKTLQNQAEEFKKKVPDFNLQEALNDPRFFNKTLPGSGCTVEEAYNAIHHDEIVERRITEAVEKATQALSRSMRAGNHVPTENGASGRHSEPMAEKAYSAMTQEERAAYYQQLTGRPLRRR